MGALETAFNGPEIGDDSQTVCANEVAPVKRWSEIEIQDWCRATMRMASEAFEQELSRMENSTSTPFKKGGAKKQCLEARSEVINHSTLAVCKSIYT